MLLVVKTCLNICKNSFIFFFFKFLFTTFFPVKHNCILLFAWGGTLGGTPDARFSLTTHPEYQQILLALSSNYTKFRWCFSVPQLTLFSKPSWPSVDYCHNLLCAVLLPLESGRRSDCLHIEIRSCRSFKVNGFAVCRDQILEMLFPESHLFFPPPQASSTLFLLVIFPVPTLALLLVLVEAKVSVHSMISLSPSLTTLYCIHTSSKHSLCH